MSDLDLACDACGLIRSRYVDMPLPIGGEERIKGLLASQQMWVSEGLNPVIIICKRCGNRFTVGYENRGG